MKNANHATSNILLSEDSAFAISEAYKTIRTNLIFSIPDERCKKILFTSAVQHEGKSITTINTGIAFAASHARVLLIDCDLRLPTCAEKLKIPEKPGLSNILVRMCEPADAIRHLENGLDVIVAGEIPPNPSELLGSEQLDQLIQQLEERYDYILFDAPPVCAVTDSVILSAKMSGVVLVVGRETSNQELLAQTIRQLSMTDAKILGFIFNGAKSERSKKYGYYRNYGKYGYGYGYGSKAKK